MKNKIIIIPLSFNTGIPYTGSERTRCDWMLPYLPADKYDGSQNVENYDIIIYQKTLMPGMAKHWRGKKIQILDVGDPVWFNYKQEKLRAMWDHMDAFVTATESVAACMWSVFPDYRERIHVIHDRIEPRAFTKKKEPVDTDRPKFVWWGYRENFMRIAFLLQYINVEDLIVISDGFIGVGTYIKHNFATEQDDILRGDIVLQTVCDQCMKTSYNKFLIAWALGLPVASNKEEIELWKNYHERKKVYEARKFDIALDSIYHVKKSAQEMWSIIFNIKEGKR